VLCLSQQQQQQQQQQQLADFFIFVVLLKVQERGITRFFLPEQHSASAEEIRARTEVQKSMSVGLSFDDGVIDGEIVDSGSTLDVPGDDNTTEARKSQRKSGLTSRGGPF